MHPTAFEDLATSVGRLPAETGALLGGDPATGLVTEVRFDAGAARTATAYTPDVTWVNRLLHESWNPRGIRLLGIAHSHPIGHPQPSLGDVLYAQRILDAISDLERFELPIVQPGLGGSRPEIHPWRVVRATPGAAPPVLSTSLEVVGAPSLRPWDWFAAPTFERVAPAVNLPLLARCRVVVVGVGGAAQFVESLVRQGVGEVVLIDPDRVEAPNLATQQVYRSDLGARKVHALARRLADINPDAVVRAIPLALDDLSEASLTDLATRTWTRRPAPEVVLWCACTDDFWAQARVNRLALHHGHPVLAGQVYERGRGVEVAFGAPGHTPACVRCALGHRYRAWLEQGWSTPGRSGGTPLFATDRVNALKSEIAMTLLHGCAGPAWAADPATRRWRDLLERMGNRNLVLVRLDPDISASLGLRAFDEVFAGADENRLLVDDTIWLPQSPDGVEDDLPPCGDCGSTGDLRTARGTFLDTRLRPATATKEVAR